LFERDEKRKLTCPARPKFRVGQTKKEVETNEEGWFKKWLEGVDGVMKPWIDGEGEEEDQDGDDEGEVKEEVDDGQWPRSPSWFEANLEVWRQL